MRYVSAILASIISAIVCAVFVPNLGFGYGFVVGVVATLFGYQLGCAVENWWQEKSPSSTRQRG